LETVAISPRIFRRRIRSRNCRASISGANHRKREIVGRLCQTPTSFGIGVSQNGSGERNCRAFCVKRRIV
jgi:hypothetical protein